MKTWREPSQLLKFPIGFCMNCGVIPCAFPFYRSSLVQRIPDTRLSCIHGMDNSTQRKLRSTVFGSEACVAYCKLLEMSLFSGFAMWKNLKIPPPFQGEQTWRSSSQSRVSSKFLFWVEVMASSFCNSQVFNLLVFLFPRKNTEPIFAKQERRA